ncbi:MAG: serine/threonine-protein kinase [Ignavibacteria bacterium]|jgi:serine/threonine-protein kinase
MIDGSNKILFDKFEIVEVLKKDDTAAVYLANHIFLSKKIILKTLNTKKMINKVAEDMFKREAQILAKLDHPNIIKVYDFGTHGDYFYISFEYFGNSNLRHHINENKLTRVEKKKLLVQLYKGLRFAHVNKIIHRDIKPENIFLNENLELKLGDFGLAKALDENLETGKYAIVGTPCYMSPEQIEGGSLSEQSDIFSAGVLVYEFYSGKNIFLGDNVNETINNVINYDFESVKDSFNEFPDDIKQVIEKSLQKEIGKRFDSVNEILKIIDDEFQEIKTAKKIVSPKNYLTYTAVVAVILTLVILFSLQTNNNKDLPVKNSENKIADLTIKNDNKTGGEKDKNTQTAKKEDVDHIENQTINKEPEKNIEEKSLEIVDKPAVPPVSNEIIAYGSLNIQCVPWADVLIDNKVIDTTPLSDVIRLKVGEHKLKLIHPDYPEIEKIIDINENETTNLFVNLNKTFGWLNFRVHPWGEIFVNKKFIGQTPMDAAAPLLPGNYNLEIRNPNYKSELKNIDVKGGDTILVIHNFEKNIDE